ncbi:MAG: amino acid permease [Solitalea-like symbiont of Acarus siro]
MVKYIFKKKQYSASNKSSSLRKHLGLWNLVFFGIASIIGGGAFSTIGQATAYGGPAVILLFFIIALVCCLVAFSYAELSSRFPLSGSAYSYSYIIFGEIIAWLVGWTLIVEYTVGNIVVAISFSEYLVSILHSIKIDALGINGIHIPKWLSANYFDVLNNYKQVEALIISADASGITSKLQSDWMLYKSAPTFMSIPIIVNLPALLVTLFVSYFAYIGISMSNKANNIMVTIKFAVIVIIVVAGLFYIKIDNWVPFMPETFNKMLTGLSAIFFGYVGFDAISMVSEEAKNPKKDISKALIISLVLCAAIYIIIALTITGIVPYKELNIANPLSYVFAKVHNSPLVVLVSVCVLVSMMNALMAFQVAQPRLIMNMSRDKLLPKCLSIIHGKYKTPHLATILVALLVALPASIAGFNFAIDLTSLGALFVFMIVCLSAIKLRLNDNHASNNNFKIPFINAKYILCIAVLLMSMYLTIFKKYEVINFVKNHSIVIKDKEDIIANLNANDLKTIKIYFENKDFYRELNKLSVNEQGLLLDKINIDRNKIYSSSIDNFLAKIPKWIFIIAVILSIYFSIKYKVSLLPLIGFLFCLYFASELSFNTWIGFLIWLFIGVLVYFIYGYRKSNQ